MHLGIKHINFWTLGGEAGLEAGAGSFDVCEQQDILVAMFLATNHCVTGGPSGKVSVFEDGMGIVDVDAHARGSVDEDDPQHMLRKGGSTALRLCEGTDPPEMLSGGGDGQIIRWKVETVRAARVLVRPF